MTLQQPAKDSKVLMLERWDTRYCAQGPIEMGLFYMVRKEGI